jgi:hypothetical protein
VLAKPESGHSITWNKIAWFLLLVLIGCNVYRAATQSITTDEAFTYERFVSKPFAGLFEPFDANNHVLHSLLARLSVHTFHLSEWSLRLPSVLGGAIYLFAVHRLCFLLYGGGLWSFMTTAVLVTNPFLLDYLSAARGYGLALGFLVLGIYNLIRPTERLESSSLYLAGICFGLSISANLTWLFPVAAFVIAFIATRAATGGVQISEVWSELIVPTLVVPFIFLIWPFSKAQAQDLYFGARHLADTVQSLADYSFAYRPITIPGLGSFDSLLQWSRVAARPSGALLLTACLAFGGRSLHHLAISRDFRENRSEIHGCLMALSFAATTSLVIAAHRVVGVLYPLTRTALYFLPLSFLAASSLFYRFRQYRVLRLAAAAGAAVCLTVFALEANLSSYAEWRFDAGTKRIVRFISSRDEQKRLKIRASWPMEPSLNFYRLLYGLNWEPVDRTDPKEGGDLVVLKAGDQEVAEMLGWRIIYGDPVSGAMVGILPHDRTSVTLGSPGGGQNHAAVDKEPAQLSWLRGLQHAFGGILRAGRAVHLSQRSFPG